MSFRTTDWDRTGVWDSYRDDITPDELEAHHERLAEIDDDLAQRLSGRGVVVDMTVRRRRQIDAEVVVQGLWGGAA